MSSIFPLSAPVYESFRALMTRIALGYNFIGKTIGGKLETNASAAATLNALKEYILCATLVFHLYIMWAWKIS